MRDGIDGKETDDLILRDIRFELEQNMLADQYLALINTRFYAGTILGSNESYMKSEKN